MFYFHTIQELQNFKWFLLKASHEDKSFTAINNYFSVLLKLNKLNKKKVYDNKD